MNGGIAGVGERLRNAREAKGWSRAELARKTGVGEKTITKAEGRASAPEAGTLLVLAKALDQDPWFLTFGATTLPKSGASADDLGETVSRLKEEIHQNTLDIAMLQSRQADAVSILQRLDDLDARMSALGRRGRKAG